MIVCGECHRPHYIYSRKKLNDDEKAQVTDIIESRLYTCGSMLFPPTSEFHTNIVVQRSITCASPMEVSYFSAKLVHFPPTCYWCGGIEEMLLRDNEYHNLSSQFQIVYAICFLCKAEGKACFTRHPLNSCKRPHH